MATAQPPYNGYFEKSGLAALEEVAGNGPVTAYALMALLRRRLARRIDPPTVYRALDFLTGAGLVFRLESRGTYAVRDRPGQAQLCVLLLCDRCETTVEYEDPKILRLIEEEAIALGFRVAAPIIECRGMCERCSGTEEERR